MVGLGRAERETGATHTTICLRPSRGLRMNLRVRSVTGESESAILAVGWLSMLAMLPRSRDPEGLQWDFPRGGDFAGCCARVELKKFRSGLAELCASPNLNCGPNCQAESLVGQRIGRAPHIPTWLISRLRRHLQFWHTRVASRCWLSVVCAPNASHKFNLQMCMGLASL
jgi:hypothetical protein